MAITTLQDGMGGQGGMVAASGGALHVREICTPRTPVHTNMQADNTIRTLLPALAGRKQITLFVLGPQPVSFSFDGSNPTGAFPTIIAGGNWSSPVCDTSLWVVKMTTATATSDVAAVSYM